LAEILNAFGERWLQTIRKTHDVPEQQIVGTVYGPLKHGGKLAVSQC
jgi:hypothetical protein